MLASGACNIARVPAFANLLPPSIMCLSAQQYRIVKRRGLAPFDRQLGLVAQLFQCLSDARGAFRVPGTRIAGAAFISDNFHKLNSLVA